MTEAADVEVWDYTFGERAPDFVLMIRGETIGRVYHCDVRNGGPRWVWTIVCAMRWATVEKPAVPLGWEAETTADAIKAEVYQSGEMITAVLAEPNLAGTAPRRGA